jgi:hypothetical protein
VGSSSLFTQGGSRIEPDKREDAEDNAEPDTSEAGWSGRGEEVSGAVARLSRRDGHDTEDQKHDHFDDQEGEPAAAAAAGALSTTARTGAIAAAERAIALGMVRTPRWSPWGAAAFALERASDMEMNSPLCTGTQPGKLASQ